MNISKVKSYTVKKVHNDIRALQGVKDMPEGFTAWASRLKKAEVQFVADMEFPVYSSEWCENFKDGEIPQEEVDCFYGEIFQTVIENWYR